MILERNVFKCKFRDLVSVDLVAEVKYRQYTCTCLTIILH